MPGHDFAACHSSKVDVSSFRLSRALLNISVSPLPKRVLQTGKLGGPSLSVYLLLSQAIWSWLSAVLRISWFFSGYPGGLIIGAE